MRRIGLVNRRLSPHPCDVMAIYSPYQSRRCGDEADQSLWLEG